MNIVELLTKQYLVYFINQEDGTIVFIIGMLFMSILFLVSAF